MNAIIKENISTATYSAEDNKIRLYCSERLDDELYQRVKAARFGWAPKQGLFYAHWNPTAEDLAVELAGFIGDESTSLAERAEQRAERFEGYQENRLKDAEQAATEHAELDSGGVVTSSDNWRQQRKAHKKANRIESLAKRTIQMWETSEYWASRAQGVISSANYKDRVDVRARRVKKLAAEQRKYNKRIEEAELFNKLWLSNKELTYKRARAIANSDHVSGCYSLEEYPRAAEVSQYEGAMGLWSALEGILTPEQARDIAVSVHNRTIARCGRWVTHLELRLTYERTILEAQGYKAPEKAKRPKQPPLLNYKAPEGLQMEGRGWKSDVKTWNQIEITKAEYKKIYSDWKFTRNIDGHRVRCAIIYDPADTTSSGFGRRMLDVCVFLTDSKEHSKPEAS